MNKQDRLLALASAILPENILSTLDSEDFDQEKVISDYQKHSRDLILNSLDKSEIPSSVINVISTELKDSLKAEYNAKAFGTAEQKIRKFGIKSEDARKHVKEGEDVKLEHWLKALDEHVKSSTSATDSEWKDKYDTLNGEKLELIKKLETVEADFTKKLEDQKFEFEQVELNKNLTLGFKAIVNELRGTTDKESVWSNQIGNRAVESVLKAEIEANGYKEIFEDGKYKIVNEDGTKITNGKDFLSTDDVLKTLGKKAGILKVANGGGGQEGEEGNPEGANVEISSHLQGVLNKYKPRS